jgi:hypothetical protein
MQSKATKTAVPTDLVELSPKKTIGDWKAIRDQLSAGVTSQIWEGVLRDFYYERLKSRYLDPIKAIQSKPEFKGEGFAIVAIQCSLIEFLESCLQGRNYNYKNPVPPYEYNISGDLFVSFFTERQPFKPHFDRHLARAFYTEVRCAVLHEARTKGKWVIKARNPSLIVDSNERILYRDNFQEGIIQFISDYRSMVPQDIELQEAFIRKFNHLCIC